ncbi:MAG: peptidoglycan D,D-transpeptidase FtsI family protein [Phototrophicaceae bacterium]
MATITKESVSQQEVLRQRIPFVVIGLLIVCGVLVMRLISFQFPQDPRVMAEFAALRDANYGTIQRLEAPRGRIYDRSGNPLAVNTREYRVGISPNVVSNKAQVAQQLAMILNRDELEMYNMLMSNSSYELLGVVSPDVWRQLDQLGLYALRVERVQRRLYPQGTLASQLVGFVAGVGEDASGYNGVEGYYQAELAGLVRDQEVSNIPFELGDNVVQLNSGADLVLTIDRDIQFLAETHLQLAISETGASGGTIIVMNPTNGDILGMASYPTYDPNRYFDFDQRELRNPAISDTFEPGSVFKVITMAAALDSGAITPDWTYNDQAEYVIGGIRIRNWDRQAYGVVNATQVLVDSLNVGTAVIAREEMGWETFYRYVDRFGFGRLTRVDMQGEEAGLLRTPTSSEWSESDLGTNSFGQGMLVTPLQMLTAVNAIANGGLMMQPRIVHQKIEGDQIQTSRVAALGRPISAETAAAMTDMMVAAVRDGLDERAQVPGYTIAGKTGTAQIWGVVDYLPDAFIMSVAGFLPADDPQVSVLIKLDRPTSGRWASQVVAPVFSRFVSRLVDLLEIPTDEVRYALVRDGATGATVAEEGRP